MTGSHIQTFPFLIRAITPVFSHLSPLFLGSNFASRCYLPCLLLIWQWSLQHDCPQWPLVKSLFTYNWCIQAINDDKQLALIGHVIACIVRKGFPSNRQTVWPQIERLSALSSRVGQVLLRRLGATGAAVSRQPVCSREGDPPLLLLLLLCRQTLWHCLTKLLTFQGCLGGADDTDLWDNIICRRTPVVASRPVCLLLAPQSWALPCGPELDTGRKDCWHAGAY